MFRTFAIHENDAYAMNMIKICGSHNEMCNFMLYIRNLNDDDLNNLGILTKTVEKNNWTRLFEDFETYDKIMRSNSIEDRHKDALWLVM